MRKNILFISTISSVMHIPVWKALENLGFNIHFIDFRGNPILQNDNPIHRAANRLPTSIKLYLNNKANEVIDKKILETAKKVKPDYIFVTKAKYLSLPTIDTLRDIAPILNWYADMMSNWGTIKKIINHYDYFFNYDRYVIDLLHKEGHNNAYHLPWAGDMQKNESWPNKKNYKYNIAFIGSYHPQLFPREASFDGLEDLGLNIWGNNAWLKTPLKKCYKGYLDPKKGQKEIQKVYQESKIGLYFDSLYDVPGTGITLRPFEITSSGSMMLGQMYRKELSDLFTPGKEFISFSGVDELKSKAKYYLEHEEERVNIAKAGFERTRSQHTYIDRVNTIFEIIKNNPPIKK